MQRRGRGRCDPEGNPDPVAGTHPVTDWRPRGYPGFLFCFQTGRRLGYLGALAVVGHTAGRTCRRTNRGNAKSGGNGVCEATASGKKLKFGQAGNAPVSEVDVLLALTQQSLHATQLLDHGNRRDGVRSGSGEAWALADGSIPIRICSMISEPYGSRYIRWW